MLPEQKSRIADALRSAAQRLVAQAGVAAEVPAVFEDTHHRVLAWLADGTLDGVRVDHPDGLRDPAEYTRRLRAAAERQHLMAGLAQSRQQEMADLAAGAEHQDGHALTVRR